jgi:hypothetical protein
MREKGRLSGYFDAMAIHSSPESEVEASRWEGRRRKKFGEV